MKIVDFEKCSEESEIQAKKIAEMIAVDSFFNDHTADGSADYMIHAVGITNRGEIVGLLSTERHPIFSVNTLYIKEGRVHMSTASVGCTVNGHGELSDVISEMNKKATPMEVTIKCIIYVPYNADEDMLTQLKGVAEKSKKLILKSITVVEDKGYATTVSGISFKTDSPFDPDNIVAVEIPEGGIVVLAIEWTREEGADALNRFFKRSMETEDDFNDVAAHLVADMLKSKITDYDNMLTRCAELTINKEDISDNKEIMQQYGIIINQYAMEYMNFILKFAVMMLEQDRFLLDIAETHGLTYDDVMAKVMSAMGR